MNALPAVTITASEVWVTVSVMLVGVLTPALISVINHPIWSSNQKRVIAVAGAAVLGILTVVGNGVFTEWEANLPNSITVILAVVGASQAAYALLWKPSGAAETIEVSVNAGPEKAGP